MKSREAKDRNNRLSMEEYLWYRSRGICPRCGKRYAEPGRVYCEPCKKRSKSLRERNDPGANARKAYNVQRRARLKAAGICTDCAKRKVAEGRTRCPTCLAKMTESRRKYAILQKIKREAEACRAAQTAPTT